MTPVTEVPPTARKLDELVHATLLHLDPDGSAEAVAELVADAVLESGDELLIRRAVEESALTRVRRACRPRPVPPASTPTEPVTAVTAPAAAPAEAGEGRGRWKDTTPRTAAAPSRRWASVRALHQSTALLTQQVITERGPVPLGECTVDDVKDVAQRAAGAAREARMVARQYLGLLALMRDADAERVSDLGEDRVRAVLADAEEARNA